EGLLADGIRQLARGELQAARKPAPLREHLMLRVARGDRIEPALDPDALVYRRGAQCVVGPEATQRFGAGDECRANAAEGAVVLARLPDVEFWLDERQRHRDAVTADRLREADDVGDDSGLFETEEIAGAATAHLHV